MARKLKKVQSKGKLSRKDKLKMINKLAGNDVAHDLTQENPTDVYDWIPTSSTWLDSIVCRGKLAGIPVGRITELAGLSGTGKSYMAAQISGNAQRKGYNVYYFDSESAISSDFLEKCGCIIEDPGADDGDFVYIQAQNVEFVLETIEAILASGEENNLFVWDSLALTPAIADLESDFNPQSTMAVKPRILSKGLAKLLQPISNSNSALLVLNQLKDNITRSPAEAMTTPYFTPGGKALIYSYSLRIWLTGRKAKASFVYDDKGYRVGSEVKCKLEKSRFGTHGRTCNFKILWGDEVGIQDEESWFDAISPSDCISSSGAWFTLARNGYEKRFQKSKFAQMAREDQEFRKQVLEIIDEEVIMKFDKRLGEASQYYDEES
ncbi:MAG: putative recombination and repair protein [Prokaryotic dsDNA virus sp.]|nr:MAG: putative recombination and repair protein [Prokaryotic dsDNA virus sp.]|tara:strand:+ start:35204 stop:36340 length:1137 start_codon:yes stop_codon:yes gene_type:complete